MTREIDPKKLERGSLSWEEAEYLRVRGKLPANYEMPDPPDTPDPEPVEKVSRIQPLEDQTIPAIGRSGGIVDDGDEDYDEGWNNNQRRAELSKRGLSVDGNKDEMMDRLIRSDNDELLDEDMA